MSRKTGVWAKELHARDCVIRATIGRMLSAQYDVAAPLPDRLADLLKRFDSGDEAAAVGISDHGMRQHSLDSNQDRA